MLPIYKLMSLFLRVFSRPLINLTKRYHASNQIQNDWIRRRFFVLGTWFHSIESRINRRYLKTNLNKVTPPTIAETAAVDKGIEFFYEIIFYSIAIGFPTYELIRQARESKQKDSKLNKRVQTIQQKISGVSEKGAVLVQNLRVAQSQIRDFSQQVCTRYLLFCSYTINEEIDFAEELVRKHTATVLKPAKYLLLG